MNARVLPITNEELLAKIAKLEADLAKAKAKKVGPSMTWAKDKAGEALTIQWPGKRARYLEVEELTYILENAESVLEDLAELMKGE